MKTRTLRFILLAVPLLVTVSLLAQGLPTGTISGRAINENLGLPGVVVT